MVVQNKYNLGPVEITGVILATDVDRHGQILEIALETEDFQKYIIQPSMKGKTLIEKILNRVVIRGMVTGRDEDGNSVVQVQDYEVLDAYDDMY
jgi:hypothetical protein